MAQGIYVGVYQEGGGGNALISSDALLNKYFTITASSFAFDGTASPSGWYSTNKAHSSTGTLTLVARQNYSSVEFSYGVNSEATYDKLTVSVKGTTIGTISGTSTTSKTWSGSLSKGDVISFTYSKDSSASAGTDCGWLYNLTVTTPVVTEGEFARLVPNLAIGVAGVSRRVLYGYIGVAGVTRPCYTIAPATWAKYNCTVSTGDYYEENGTSTTSRSWETVYWTARSSYYFSTTNGYVPSGTITNYTVGDGLTGSDLVGTYVNNAGGTSLLEILSATVTDDGSQLIINATCKMYRAKLITGAKTYSQGSTSYGTVISTFGGLPAEGTHVEGSVKAGYCVREINGTYYYYVLQ